MVVSLFPQYPYRRNPGPWNLQRYIPNNRNRAYIGAGAGAVGMMGILARMISNLGNARANSNKNMKRIEAGSAVPVTVVSKKAHAKAKPKKPKSLKKQVKQLQHQMNALTSKLTYRFFDVLRVISNHKETAYAVNYQNSSAVLEGVLAQLKFFDPAAPGTLVTASGATGSYQRSYRIRSSYVYIFRNNYQVPLELRVYKYHVKTDTSIDPYTAFTNGLTDIGGPSAASPVVYPSDSLQLSELWKCDSTTIWKLEPGQQKVFQINSPWIDYDPSELDSQTETYARRFKTTSILIRIQGVPSHDKTTTTQLAVIGAGIDYSEKATYHVQYNSGGADLDIVYVQDGQDTQTAGGVVSERIVDNEEFSAS